MASLLHAAPLLLRLFCLSGCLLPGFPSDVSDYKDDNWDRRVTLASTDSYPVRAEKFSCEGATKPAFFRGAFCAGAGKYDAARRFRNISQWDFESYEEQEKRAMQLFTELTGVDDLQFALSYGASSSKSRNGISLDCLTFVKDLVCSQHFPQCLVPKARVSYRGVCGYQCVSVFLVCESELAAAMGGNRLRRRARRTSGSSSSSSSSSIVVDSSSSSSSSSSALSHFQLEDLDMEMSARRYCGSYGLTDRSCYEFEMDGLTFLDRDKMPIHMLPCLYAVLGAIWTLLCVAWLLNACACPSRAYASPLSRMLTAIPLLKVVLVLTTMGWWSTCAQWGGACSFWLGIVVVNIELLFETAFFTAFVLVAKGWCITREDMPRDEWRSLLLALCGFYLVDSLILVFRSYMGFVISWIFTALVYLSLLVFVHRGVQRNLRTLRSIMHVIQMADSENDGVEALAGPVRTKIHMFWTFRALCTVFLLSQVAVPGLIERVWNSYWPSAVFFEFMHVVVFGLGGWIFRARRHSPYFFVMPRTQSELALDHASRIAAFQEVDFSKVHVMVDNADSSKGDSLDTSSDDGDGNCDDDGGEGDRVRGKGESLDARSSGEESKEEGHSRESSGGNKRKDKRRAGSRKKNSNKKRQGEADDEEKKSGTGEGIELQPIRRKSSSALISGSGDEDEDVEEKMAGAAGAAGSHREGRIRSLSRGSLRSSSSSSSNNRTRRGRRRQRSGAEDVTVVVQSPDTVSFGVGYLASPPKVPLARESSLGRATVVVDDDGRPLPPPPPPQAPYPSRRARNAARRALRNTNANSRVARRRMPTQTFGNPFDQVDSIDGDDDTRLASSPPPAPPPRTRPATTDLRITVTAGESKTEVLIGETKGGNEEEDDL